MGNLWEIIKMLSEKEINKLKKYVGEKFSKNGLDNLSFDVEHEMDRNLTIGENKIILEEKIEQIIPTKEDVKELENKWKAMEQQNLEKTYSERKEEEMIKNWIKVVRDCKSIAITGETGSGKTSLSFYLLDLFNKYTKKKVYAYKFPDPSILPTRRINIMYSIEELSAIENAVVYLTEPQLTLPKYEKRNNDILIKILSLARQRNITIIIDTSDTGYINRGLESYINVWCVLDQEYSLVKQGGIIRKIIKDNSIIDPNVFRLNIGEYLFYSRKYYTFNGKYRFTKPSYFTDKYSKAFAKAE